ncbi:hypothetical protein B296_00057025 [Ensete ventricosum]|uniref:Uncharacterized protein n=1 Tax=Ensete ventricosum TaxID=4639 RepID=A0A426XSX3_ENSVE|nr:hypothetical protein B296_00057025 [Ensete ventricosum]
MLSFFASIAMVSSYSSSTLKEPRICDPSAAAARVSGTVAVAACAAMAFFYVAILYAPTLILRLPPPTSLDSFMIRRFACAAVSSAASVLACVLLLGVSRFTAKIDRWRSIEGERRRGRRRGGRNLFRRALLFPGSPA